MGRQSLDRALREQPLLRTTLEQAEEHLARAIKLLAPYAPSVPDDPDLTFQIRILAQARHELQFMLDERRGVG